MSSLSVVERVLREEGDALLQASLNLRNDPGRQADLQATLKLFETTLARGGRIAISGVGKSGIIAQKIASTLNSLGLSSIFLHATEALHGDLGALRTTDAAWAISQSGKSPELLDLVAQLAHRGIAWIAMTGERDSPLTDGASGVIWTDIREEACAFKVAPTTSTTLALAWGDAIAVELMTRRGTPLEVFSANHPGGSLGKRLGLRVKTLMSPPNETPTVDQRAPLSEVIAALNQYRMGGVLVVQGQEMLGIITEGDLRKALLSGASCFSKQASDLMTTQPVVGYPEQLAWEALQLMEDRPHALSVLPIVQMGSRTWCGLLRLHDLLQQL